MVMMALCLRARWIVRRQQALKERKKVEQAATEKRRRAAAAAGIPVRSNGRVECALRSGVLGAGTLLMIDAMHCWRAGCAARATCAAAAAEGRAPAQWPRARMLNTQVGSHVFF